jgi:hypothetical protein
MNISRERVRQVEVMTLLAAQESVAALGIEREDLADGFGHAEGFLDEGAPSGEEGLMLTRRRERAAKKAA